MKQQFDALVEHLVSGNIFLEEAIELLERKMIERALQMAGGKQTEASKRLGIHRNTLQRKMVEYELQNGRQRRKTVARAVRTARKKPSAA